MDGVLAFLHHLAAPSARDGLTDQELLRRFSRERDENAFVTLLQRHGPLVFRVCRGVLPGSHDAEDVFQAVFLILARKAGSLGQVRSLEGWLHTVTVRLARRLRARQHRERHEPILAEPRAEPADLSWREAQSVLHEEIERLPASYRQPILLCYFLGLTRDEAAGRLGWTAGTLKGRLERARKLLHRRLQRRGISLAILATVVTPPLTRAAVPALLEAATARATLAVTLHAEPLRSAVSPRVARLVDLGLHGGMRGFAALVLLVTLLGAVGWACLAAGRETPGPPLEKSSAPLPREMKRTPTDKMGDALPAGAVARLGTLRLRHLDRVFGLAFAPDGKTLASASHDHTAAIWDTRTGRLLHRLRGHRYAVDCVAYSPDGRLLATGSSDCTVRVWDAASGRMLRTCEGHTGWVNTLGFLPDGKRVVSGSFDFTVRLWDVNTGKEVQRLPAFDKEVLRLACAPGGRLLAVVIHGDTLQLWDHEQKKCLRSFRGDHPCFSPNGQTLALADGKTLELRDVATGKLLRAWTDHARDVESVAFSPDGKTIASGEWRNQGTVRLWDVETGRCRQRWPGHDGGTFALAFSPDGRRLASAGGDLRVCLRDTTTGEEVPALPGHASGIGSLSASPRGPRLVSAGWDETLLFWDVDRGRVLRSIATGHRPVGNVLYSPDGKYIATFGTDSDFCLWDAETGKLVYRRDRRGMIAFAPDGRSLVINEHGKLSIWETATGKTLRTLDGVGFQSIAFSADGKQLAAGLSGNRVAVYDLATLKEVRAIQLPVSEDKHQPAMAFVAFAPDSRTLAFGNEHGEVHLWDTVRWKSLGTLADDSGGVIAVAYSPTGRLLATATWNGTVTLWEVASRKAVFRCRGHESSIRALAFLEDGKRFVTGSSDSTLLVWDVAEALSRPQR